MQTFKLVSLIFLLGTAVFAAKAPNWVENKPVIPSKYIGVGVATKSQYGSKEEWIKAAESRALANISEAISVTIEGNSKVTTTATNTDVQSLINESIKTFTKANLEGYQFVESWEDKKEYWVYYTLDKATWQAIEQKRLREAVAKSQSFLDNAQRQADEANTVSAIRGLVQAYGELIPVLHLDPRFSVNGAPVPATAHLDDKLVSLLNTISIDMKKPLYSGTKTQFGTKEPKITVRTPKGSVGAFPLLIAGQKRFSGNDGTVSIGKSYVDNTPVSSTGEVQIPLATDYEQLTAATPANPILLQWLSKQKWPTASALIRFTKAAIFVETAEATYSDVPSEELTTALKAKIIENGFAIAKYTDESDLRVVINSSSRVGGSMGNLYFSYVDLSWSLFNQAGDELMTETLPSVKDGALSYDDATIKAYKKAAVTLSTRIASWIQENQK